MMRKIFSKISSFFYAHSQYSNPKKKKFRYDQVEIFPDDIFLVAYPKSGVTWLRFLIGNYLTNNQCNFDNSHQIVPDIHYNPEQCAHISSPRFIKSHFPFSPQFLTHHYPKVVYLARDGRDVAVSYYYYLKRHGIISETTSFHDYLLMFHQGTIDQFSNWNLHVNFWLDHAPETFLLIRYEDMKREPLAGLQSVLEFAGLDVHHEKITEAVNASRFENMRQQERQQTFSPIKIADPSIPFIREGKSGDWKNMFTDELHDEFLCIHRNALERLNYV